MCRVCWMENSAAAHLSGHQIVFVVFGSRTNSVEPRFVLILIRADLLKSFQLSFLPSTYLQSNWILFAL